MVKEKSAADNLFEALIKSPNKVLEWAEEEIKEYKKLIKLIKKSTTNCQIEIIEWAEKEIQEYKKLIVIIKKI